MLSPEGPFAHDGAKKAVIVFPSVLFSDALKCGTTVVKVLGEIHNQTPQPRHWWHPLRSNFYTFLTPTFPPRRYFNRDHPDALYFLLYRGGKEAANQLANRQRGSVSSRLLPEVFWYFQILLLLPLTSFILPWLQIGCLIACSGGEVGLTNTCLAVQTGDTGGVCVFTSSRRSEVSGGTPPLDVKECL